jgi:hypothetical protein
MSGAPWERYAQQAAPTQEVADGPWMKYAGGEGARVSPDNIIRQVAKGATFNFADEIAAGTNALTGALIGKPGTIGERYAAALLDERGKDKTFEAANPYLSTGLQIAGSVANPVSRVAQTGNLLMRGIKGIAQGGLLGGVAGVGEGEGEKGRFGSGVTGAATGAAIGGALPFLAQGVATAGRKIGGWLGMNVPRSDAERLALRQMAAAGETPATARAALDAAGDQPMMLADVGGPTLAGQASAVARMPGQGQAAATAVLKERGGLAQSARLDTEVKRAISADDWLATRNDLVASRSKAARPKYEEAFTRIIPTAEEGAKVARFIRDPIGQDALQKGLRVIELENLADDIPFDPKAYGVIKGDDGKFILEPDKVPTLRLMDAVKRGYDEIVEGFRNDVGVLQLDQYGRAVNNVRAAYRDTLTDMFPRYGGALKAWSGPSEALDALNMGRKVISGDFDATSQVVAKMSPSELDMFKIGVARELTDRVKSTGDTADLTKLKKLWGSQSIRERLMPAFEGEASFNKFRDYMERELTMAKTNALIDPRGGSPTEILRRYNEQADAGVPGGMVQGLISGARGDVVGTAANISRVLGAPQDATAVYNELAPILFAMKPGDRARVLDQLANRLQTEQRSTVVGKRLGDALLKGGITGAVDRQN